MSILLVCGDGNSGYLEVLEALRRAGLAPAEPSKRERFDPATLSERVCASNGIDPNNPETVAQLELGRVWQALSVDLMIANMARSDWGWADPRLVYMLDHWRDFDPQVKFVLVYSSPEQAVAELISTEEVSDEKIAAGLALWAAVNSELLKFYHANRDRCLLVNAAAVAEDSRFFLGLARDHLKAKLEENGLEVGTRKKRGPIFDLVASLLVKDADDAQDLFQELESSADIPGGRVVAATPEDLRRLHNVLPQLGRPQDLDPRELARLVWEQYWTLRRQAEAATAEVETGRKIHEEQRREIELVGLQLAHSQEELDTSLVELRARTDELRARTAELDVARSQLVSVRHERDVQRTILAAKEREVGELSAVRDALSATNASLEDRLAAMSRERDVQRALLAAKEREVGELAAARDALSASNASFESRLSTAFLELEAQRAILAAREREITELSAAREALSSTNASLEDRLASTTLELGAQRALLAARDREVGELSAAREALSSTNASLEDRLASTSRELGAQRALLTAKEREVGELSAAREALSATNASLEERLVSTTRELGAQRAVLVARDREVGELSAAREALSATNASLEERLVSTTRELGAQRAVLVARDREVGELSAAREALSATNASLTDRLAAATRDLDAMIGAKSTLEEKLAVVSIERDEIAREQARVAAELQGARDAAARSHASDAAARASEAKVRDLAMENELLHMQLAQVQEELELHFRKAQEVAVAVATPVSGAEKAAAAVRPAVAEPTPAKPEGAAVPVVLDMRNIIDGDGWYYAEHDGRWSGPKAVSRLRLPKVEPGVYTVELDIVDAMSPIILRGTTATLDGRPLKLRSDALRKPWWSRLSRKKKKVKYPVLLTAVAKITSGDPEVLEIRVPETISPSSRGSKDMRQLGIRLRRATLVKK